MVKNLIHTKKDKYLIFLLLIFIFVFCIYLFTSSGKTPYDYFTRLALSFLEGKYYLEENPPWLNELIPGGVGRFFVVYPPMPAILSIPFVLIFSQNFPQQILAHLLGAGVTLIFSKITFTITKSYLKAVWISLLVAFGNIIWFLASNGSSWYLGQVSASFFLSLALFEIISKKRPFLIGIFLGAAYLSRVHILITLPIIFLMIVKKEKLKTFFYLLLGLLPFLVFNAFYNFIRFGVFWDIGYKLIPGVLEEPWYQHGLVHPLYIPSHLKILFTSLPKFSRTKPFIQPSWGGLAIWITTPAFLYSIFAPLKQRFTKLLWVSIFLISLIIFSHGSTGFTQFGYRFAFDFYPFLFLLTILGIKNKKLQWHHWLLLSISIAVNAWGVLWINKFNWVSF